MRQYAKIINENFDLNRFGITMISQMTYLSCLFVGGVCAPHCSSDMNSHNSVAFVDNKYTVFSPSHFYLQKDSACVNNIIHYLKEFSLQKLETR